ncbi:MAG: right-handed parallel beta-helix repeat-containing protein, partial [Candidatus Micrarchaeia archaeon]
MDEVRGSRRGQQRMPLDIGRRTLTYSLVLFLCVIFLYAAFFLLHSPENLAKLVYTQLAQGGEEVALQPVEKCNPPSEGAWNVVDAETCRMVTIQLTGDLIVESTLNLYNTTILINSSTDGEHAIIVKPGGTLIAYGSRFSPAGSNAYLFRADEGSTLVLQDSEVRGAGYDLGLQGELAGLYILTGNARLERTTFRNNYIGASFRNSKRAVVTDSKFIDNLYGLRISDSTPQIYSSSFSSQIYDIYATDFSSATAQDSQFSFDKVAFGDTESNLSVKRTATFQVTDLSNAPLDNATVYIYSADGAEVGRSTTVEGASASAPLPWAEMNSAGATFHAYSLSTSFNSTEGPHAVLDFNQSNTVGIV